MCYSEACVPQPHAATAASSTVRNVYMKELFACIVLVHNGRSVAWSCDTA